MVGLVDRKWLTWATDALVTNAPGVVLMLRFADCVPLLFYDPVHHAIGSAGSAGTPPTIWALSRSAAGRTTDWQDLRLSWTHITGARTVRESCLLLQRRSAVGRRRPSTTPPSGAPRPTCPWSPHRRRKAPPGRPVPGPRPPPPPVEFYRFLRRCRGRAGSPE